MEKYYFLIKKDDYTTFELHNFTDKEIEQIEKWMSYFSARKLPDKSLFLFLQKYITKNKDILDRLAK